MTDSLTRSASWLCVARRRDGRWGHSPVSAPPYSCATPLRVMARPRPLTYERAKWCQFSRVADTADLGECHVLGATGILCVCWLASAEFGSDLSHSRNPRDDAGVFH